MTCWQGEPVESPGEWEADAACKEHPGLFVLPAKGKGNSRRKPYGRAVEAQIDAAVSVCAGCLVFDECLRWATTLPDPAYSMIAAGMTPAERSAYRDARGMVARRSHGTRSLYVRGCRCDECTAADRDYMRRLRHG